VLQFAYLPELYEDARSEKYKILLLECIQCSPWRWTFESSNDTWC